MRKMPHEKKILVCRAAFLAAVFAISYILTALTPLIADDYNYAFSWADRTRVDNLTLVIKSMITHRQWTHGRVFAQGWVTIFMMWPKWAFALANAAIVTAFYAALDHFFQRTETEKSIQACLAVAALYWICMPAFGQVFLWLDGACNYFWGAVHVWILIELWQSLRNRPRKWVWMIGLLPLAFVAGAWSEHISFAMLMILFLFVVWIWVKDRKAPLFDIIVLLAGIVGYLFLMLSPSMLPTKLKNRAIIVIGFHIEALIKIWVKYWWILLLIIATAFALLLWLKKMPDRKTRWTTLSMTACGISLLFYLHFAIKILIRKDIYELISSTQIGFLLLLTGFLFVLGKAISQGVLKEKIVEAVILSIGGISSLALFALAMYIPARGFCAPVVFIGIATVRLWIALKQKNMIIRTTLVWAFLICFVFGFADILHVSQAANKREHAIEQALQTDGILMAAPYPVRTKYSAQYGLVDLENGASWPNDVIQKYYGLKDIVVESDVE